MSTATAVLESGVDDDGPYEWMLPAKAARALSLSVSTVTRMADAGRLPVKLDGRGWRRIKVTRAAIREMLAAQSRNDANALIVSVIQLAEVEGKSVTEIVLQLACPPAIVAKTLLAHDEAMAVQRRRDTQRRSDELVSGVPTVPTSWAWVVGCFDRHRSYDQALAEYETWMTNIGGGESGATVSPLVRRAIASESAWVTACHAWQHRDKLEVLRHQWEQAQLSSIDTKHAAFDVERKRLQVEEEQQRINHRENRETDRHQREMARRSSAIAGAGTGRSGSKAKSPSCPETRSRQNHAASR